MRLGVIDIGTNTILLLVAEIDRRGTIVPIHHGHVIARLGKGVDERRIIPMESILRAEGFLGQFVAESRENGATRIVACGTSALRDAANRAEVIEHFRATTGLDVRVLSGEEEAELTYRGAVNDLPDEAGQKRCGVLDIGGGSTEVTIGSVGTIVARKSLDIGCVRLTERILKTSPPKASSLKLALEAVKDALTSLSGFPRPDRLIGVAGTLTTLAAIDLQLPTYDPHRVTGHRLSRTTIQSILLFLQSKSSEELKAIPQILAGRADILVAGILILDEVLGYFKMEEVTVSDRGLRYGIALREAANALT